MNNSDYNRAQHAYDNQLPDSYYIETQDCHKCSGSGADEDGNKCYTCNGTGEVKYDSRYKRRKRKDDDNV